MCLRCYECVDGVWKRDYVVSNVYTNAVFALVVEIALLQYLLVSTD